MYEHILSSDNFLAERHGEQTKSFSTALLLFKRTKQNTKQHNVL